MEQFLESHENNLVFGAMIGLYLAAMIWELLAPRREESKRLLFRWANNIAVTAVSLIAVRWTGAILSIGVASWAADRGLGLLQYYDFGLAGAFVVTLLVMEMLGYGLHIVAHRVPLIWRLHAMHHSDTEVDFTTTYRNHPFESAFVVACTAPVVTVLGAPVAAMALYQLLRMSVNILSHSNVRIPEGVESWLRYLIVTPDFHHLHHCSGQTFTDSNYCSTVPWFDYLFGTATRKPYSDYATMELGLERFRDPVDSRFDQVLLMPFRGQRYKASPASGRQAGTGEAATKPGQGTSAQVYGSGDSP